jgi:hypothetical protein
MSSFRLASVLRLRRTLRDQCEARAAQAHLVAVAAADTAHTRHGELRATSIEAGDGADFRVAVAARDRRAASARSADSAAIAARASHQARIGELVQASMAVSALERLEERSLAAARAEEQRCEAREIDDLVAFRTGKGIRR